MTVRVRCEMWDGPNGHQDREEEGQGRDLTKIITMFLKSSAVQRLTETQYKIFSISTTDSENMNLKVNTSETSFQDIDPSFIFPSCINSSSGHSWKMWRFFLPIINERQSKPRKFLYYSPERDCHLSPVWNKAEIQSGHWNLIGLTSSHCKQSLGFQ